jgi:hypothetical protein
VSSRATFFIPAEHERRFLRYLGETGGIDPHHNPFDMLFALGEDGIEMAGMQFEFKHHPDKSQADTVEVTIECTRPDRQAQFARIVDRIMEWLAQDTQVGADAEEEELHDLELVFLRRKLTREEESLQLIEDRLSECDWETDEPIPLIEEYRQQLEVVEGLRRRIGGRSSPILPKNMGKCNGQEHLGHEQLTPRHSEQSEESPKHGRDSSLRSE